MSNGKEKDSGTGLLNKNPYTWVGIGLLIAGILVSPVAHFILALTWLTALGICMLILALILLALGRTIPKLPPEVCSLFLETGMANISAILEEIAVYSKGIYVPSSLTNSTPKVLIPLPANHDESTAIPLLPERLIVRYGENPDDFGLLLTSPGSLAVGMIELTPNPTANELESILRALIVGRLGISSGVNLSGENNHLAVEIINPLIENRNDLSSQCMGGPIASIVASVVAEARDKRVIIEREEPQGKNYFISLEILS